MSGHAPLPWRIERDGSKIEILDERGHYVLVFRGAREIEEHIAAVIVRSCNAHDDLVAALDKARNALLDGGFPEKSPLMIGIAGALSKADTA